MSGIPSTGDVAIEVSQILGQAIDLADVAGDRGPLVVGKHLPLEPGATPMVEQIGHREPCRTLDQRPDRAAKTKDEVSLQ
ncbi:hypothetical protein [Mesorhizobium sp.]|uniref:hypothetical protein n=1 Tax=Mesorhizobium sp. TaxID=1871066 RepID=UPI00257BDB24|nr:hypothetical protein [Mesorhizobium sp.]